jgi:hypothetical protein
MATHQQVPGCCMKQLLSSCSIAGDTHALLPAECCDTLPPLHPPPLSPSQVLPDSLTLLVNLHQLALP